MDTLHLEVPLKSYNFRGKKTTFSGLNVGAIIKTNNALGGDTTDRVASISLSTNSLRSLCFKYIYWLTLVFLTQQYYFLLIKS